MSQVTPTPTAQSMRHCLVIVPTYNEAENIRDLIDAILEQGAEFDVLVVDDNSPDGTGEIVAEMKGMNPRVHLLQRAGKLGLGTAYLEGYKYAFEERYLYIAQMDADFSHRPHYLPIMLGIAERVFPIVIGSRNVRGGSTENWSLLRQMISQGGSLYARLILNMPVRDCTGGFKVFNAQHLHRLNLSSVNSNGYAFQVEMNYLCHRAGYNIMEFPIVFPDRERGTSKMNWRIVKEAAFLVLKLRAAEFLNWLRWEPSGAAATKPKPDAKLGVADLSSRD